MTLLQVCQQVVNIWFIDLMISWNQQKKSHTLHWHFASCHKYPAVSLQYFWINVRWKTSSKVFLPQPWLSDERSIDCCKLPICLYQLLACPWEINSAFSIPLKFTKCKIEKEIISVKHWSLLSLLIYLVCFSYKCKKYIFSRMLNFVSRCSLTW